MRKSIYGHLLGIFISSLLMGVLVSSVYTHFQLEKQVLVEVQSQLETSIRTMQSFIRKNDVPFENLETFQGDHSLIFKFSKTLDEYDLSKAQLNVMDTDVIFFSEGNPG